MNRRRAGGLTAPGPTYNLVPFDQTLSLVDTTVANRFTPSVVGFNDEGQTTERNETSESGATAAHTSNIITERPSRPISDTGTYPGACAQGKMTGERWTEREKEIVLEVIREYLESRGLNDPKQASGKEPFWINFLKFYEPMRLANAFPARTLDAV